MTFTDVLVDGLIPDGALVGGPLLRGDPVLGDDSDAVVFHRVTKEVTPSEVMVETMRPLPVAFEPDNVLFEPGLECPPSWRVPVEIDMGGLVIEPDTVIPWLIVLDPDGLTLVVEFHGSVIWLPVEVHVDGVLWPAEILVGLIPDAVPFEVPLMVAVLFLKVECGAVPVGDGREPETISEREPVCKVVLICELISVPLEPWLAIVVPFHRTELPLGVMTS